MQRNLYNIKKSHSVKIGNIVCFICFVIKKYGKDTENFYSKEKKIILYFIICPFIIKSLKQVQKGISEEVKC